MLKYNVEIPMRIVSLIASATEIVAALGFEADLVGISHECDFPPAITSRPRLTSPKFPVDGTSYDIDQRVRAIVQEGLSVYRVDGEALRALSPEVIITQTQCEVCAVSERDLVDILASWTGARPVVVSLKPDTLGDVWADIRRVAAALGAAERGEELVARLDGRMAHLASFTYGLDRPTLAAVEWIEPLMMGANWMPELIGLAGGFPGTLDEADVTVVVPCGWDLERTRAEMGAREWRGRVVLADGNQYFNRPGPRLVESLEILAEILHPGVFDFGHRGRGWVEYQTGSPPPSSLPSSAT